MWARRDILKLGSLIAAGGVVAPLIAACSTPSPDGATPLAGAITVVSHAGDPGTEPALLKVFDDFKAQNPGVEWDIRELPGGGPEWDRLARASIAAGEPVGLVMINGQQVRGWVRDGLLADLGADPEMADVLSRVPERFHFSGPGGSVWAFPLALSDGVHTTGLLYNKALLDRADLAPPATIADLKAMVEPLAGLGVAPLVHCSGDVFFNQILVTWLLPMIAERAGIDPLAFAERTVRGEVGYDSPEWIETFETIADLRASGVLLEGSGAVDYATMQQLFLQGTAATTFNGSWLLPQLLAGSPAGGFDLHVAPPPLVEGASRARPILAWTGFALPAKAAPNLERIYDFLRYASEAEVDKAVVEGLQAYSPIAASNVAIENEIAQEFLPMFDSAITPMDWLWEPEITAELDSQVQALVKGDTDPGAAATAVQSAARELRAAGRSYYP